MTITVELWTKNHGMSYQLLSPSATAQIQTFIGETMFLIGIKALFKKKYSFFYRQEDSFLN